MMGLLQNYLLWKLFDGLLKQASKHIRTQPVKVVAINDTVLYEKDDKAKKIKPVRVVKKGEVIGNLSYSGSIILNGQKLKVVKVHSLAYKEQYIAIHNDVEFKKNRINVIR